MIPDVSPGPPGPPRAAGVERHAGHPGPTCAPHLAIQTRIELLASTSPCPTWPGPARSCGKSTSCSSGGPAWESWLMRPRNYGCSCPGNVRAVTEHPPSPQPNCACCRCWPPTCRPRRSPANCSSLPTPSDPRRCRSTGSWCLLSPSGGHPVPGARAPGRVNRSRQPANGPKTHPQSSWGGMLAQSMSLIGRKLARRSAPWTVIVPVVLVLVRCSRWRPGATSRNRRQTRHGGWLAARPVDARILAP
jgi:hypothetical protein